MTNSATRPSRDSRVEPELPAFTYHKHASQICDQNDFDYPNKTENSRTGLFAGVVFGIRGPAVYIYMYTYVYIYIFNKH